MKLFKQFTVCITICVGMSLGATHEMSLLPLWQWLLFFEPAVILLFVVVRRAMKIEDLSIRLKNLETQTDMMARLAKVDVIV